MPKRKTWKQDAMDTKGIKKKCKTWKTYEMHEKGALSEDDVDRSTHVSSNRRLRKEARRVGVVSRCLKHEFSCKGNLKHMK